MKVVYSAFDGRYGDNPRAVFERLRGRRNGDEHVWLCAPRHAAGFPRDVPTVLVGSEAGTAALQDADVVVANTHIEVEWDKKPGAVYLQTWHGTPLKRVHHDVLWAPVGRLDRLDRDVARWDYLLSPNAVSSGRLRNAFGFTGEVLELGYPRNDVLSSAGRGAVRRRVRAQLGLGEDTLAVLYAPTWRDDQYFTNRPRPVGLELDTDALVSGVGSSLRLLARLHPLMTERSRLRQLRGVQDVSFYPDVQELYLAADVLVTDYSSAMFDFAVTGKPMIFYGYDLEDYRDQLRGFYFDLEPVAPGPLVRTTDEVLQALRRLPSVQAEYAERYAEFRRAFCHLEDGHATERLVTLIDQWRTAPGAVGSDGSRAEVAAAAR